MLFRYGRSYWRIPKDIRVRLTTTQELDSQSAVRERVSEGETYHLPPPVIGRAEANLSILAAMGAGEVKPTEVHTLPNAWLVGEHATPITATGRIILSPYCDLPALYHREPRTDVEQFDFRQQVWGRTLDGPTVSLVHRLDSNYYHWFVDVLPSLVAAWRYATRRGEGLHVLVRAAARPFVRESLSLLQLDRVDLVDWSPVRPVVRCTQLLVASRATDDVSTWPTYLGWLAQRLSRQAASLGPPRGSGNAGRVLHVVRRKGSWRTIHNIDEVCDALHAIDAETVYPEDWTLAEQVAAFSHARLVIGLHGAGLTNALFMSAGALLEIFGSYGGSDYYRLASARGLRYGLVSSKPSGDGVVVDPDALLAAARHLATTTLPPG
jgi:capsular polysaccharide biosynthesis protein